MFQSNETKRQELPIVRFREIELPLPQDGAELKRTAWRLCETNWPPARPGMQLHKINEAIEAGEDPAALLAGWYKPAGISSLELSTEQSGAGDLRIRIKGIQEGCFACIAAEALLNKSDGRLLRWSIEERMGTPLSLLWLAREIRAAQKKAADAPTNLLVASLPAVP